MTNKSRRFKGIRYHAKSRVGHEKTDIIKVKIILEEKPVEELYSLVLIGKTPPMLSYILRREILEKNQDLPIL
jgi:hypothetical protein